MTSFPENSYELHATEGTSYVSNNMAGAGKREGKAKLVPSVDVVQ